MYGSENGQRVGNARLFTCLPEAGCLLPRSLTLNCSSCASKLIGYYVVDFFPAPQRPTIESGAERLLPLLPPETPPWDGPRWTIL